MARVVLDHHRDREAGHYRLLIADEVWVRNDQGDPELAGHANHEDFLFADDDTRWKGKKPAEVAKAQREIVAAALAARTDTATAPESKHRGLPGVGEEL